ncbi:MAG TPA: amidohydrolase family protein, partial [Holophaga sp.]|nr:amidohydrolase family protein [Holophaga sp.]
AVLREGIDLATALGAITRNPAAIFKLKAKGRLEEAADADLVLVDPKTFEIETVIAKGRTMMADGRILVRGTFEN